MSEPAGKLPAYAKRLRDLRHAGHHPLFVDVLFGDDWAEARQRALLESAALPYVNKGFTPYGPEWLHMIGRPLIAIAPRDYKPGVFDFRCVAGVAIELRDQAGQMGRFDSALYFLGGELSRWGFVDLAGGGTMGIEARRARYELRRGGEDRWPAWWSDELDEEHGRKYGRWKEAASQSIEASRVASAAG